MNTGILRIAVCESNQSHLSEIVRALDQVLFSSFEYSVATFSDINLFVRKISHNINFYDLIITEIDFPKGNGLTMAKYLRSNHCRSAIVFLTGNTDRILDGYQVTAFDYLIKPVSLSRLGSMIQRFTDEKLLADQVYCYKIGRCSFSMDLDSIYYFTSIGRKISMSCKDRQVSYYGKIDDIEALLPSGTFIRPHQSYIVNLKHVCDYTRESITVRDGTEIPISRQRANETRKRLNYYFYKDNIS